MARQTTMSNILTQLRAALGMSLTVPAIGSGTDPILMQLLHDKQMDLASKYSWPFLEQRFDIDIASGSRYLNFPTTDDAGDPTAMDLERPYLVEVFWGSKWSPIGYGIGSEEFNVLNSDIAGNRQDPIVKWRWSEEGQFEIWPVAASSTQIVRFTGQRLPDTFAGLTDTADLDDRLLVLGVAADQLTKQNQRDAQLMYSKFLDRLREVRANYPAWKDLILGQDADSDLKPRTVSIKPAVAVAGG